MLGRRRRRRANIKPALGRRLVFAGTTTIWHTALCHSADKEAAAREDRVLWGEGVIRVSQSCCLRQVLMTRLSAGFTPWCHLPKCTPQSHCTLSHKSFCSKYVISFSYCPWRVQLSACSNFYGRVSQIHFSHSSVRHPICCLIKVLFLPIQMSFIFCDFKCISRF